MARGDGAAASRAGLEDTLWKAADKLRGSMDAAEYKHFVLGACVPQVCLRRVH
jgi:type I restriction-modification system DNA methylase subunit